MVSRGRISGWPEGAETLYYKDASLNQHEEGRSHLHGKKVPFTENGLAEASNDILIFFLGDSFPSLRRLGWRSSMVASSIICGCEPECGAAG